MVSCAKQKAMKKNQSPSFKAFVLFLTFLGLAPAWADEGMWTLNGFPTEKVAKKYGFRATPEWLEHVRLSSARLARGCSGSFVSANGLVMTNHHCAHSCIEQLSTPKKDYVASGFYAESQEKEVRCPEIEVNRLTRITDVSQRVFKATEGLSGQPYNDALKAVMAMIEKECAGDSKDLRCDVVTLYHGGQYHLYQYQRYQDVRLVFAPELAIAFFGGDPDNFTFPRYDLDVAFLRVYDGGKPLTGGEYFRWSKTNAGEGDLTFVTGHPGRTSRLLTISQLEFTRDVQLVQSLISLSEIRGLLTQFAARGPEQKRIAETDLFGVENSVKAQKGRLQALQDTRFFEGKKREEGTLRRKVMANAKLKKEYAKAWDEIDKAMGSLRDLYPAYVNLEGNRGWLSRLFRLARTLVRAGEELPKENGKRLREFTDSNLPAIKQELFSTAPVYNEYEIEVLTHGLTKLRENLTTNHPAVKRIFMQRSPREIAEEIVKGTRLQNVDERKRLFDGGKAAILASKDPMIQFALLVDKDARPVRAKYEDEIESIVKNNSEKIAKAKFAIYGAHNYPDATFTLRVSYGQIKGYRENGSAIAPITTVGGTFAHATGRDPFALPKSWIDAKANLDHGAPMNFCSTNDIIGGNSGSPVINSNAEIVGLIFDGNIQSLGGDYGFDESVNRAVAVHSAAIIEALKKVYHADRIVSDLTGSR